MLIFYLLCYAPVLKFLTYNAQYYAHVKIVVHVLKNLTALLEYIYLYAKVLQLYIVCSIRVY